jgi:hypothetical protein
MSKREMAQEDGLGLQGRHHKSQSGKDGVRFNRLLIACGLPRG